MKINPLGSAIYCNYSHGKYLEQCFKGLLRQNYKNFELLITGDGTTDDSRCIIERYAVRDERIKPLFFKKNQGIAAASNASLFSASGDYLCLGACDDYTTDLVQCAVEVKPLKVGKYILGIRLPIVDGKTAGVPDVYLILVWNFLEKFLPEKKDYTMPDGEFIVPIQAFGDR